MADSITSPVDVDDWTIFDDAYAGLLGTDIAVYWAYRCPLEDDLDDLAAFVRVPWSAIRSQAFPNERTVERAIKRLAEAKYMYCHVDREDGEVLAYITAEAIAGYRDLFDRARHDRAQAIIDEIRDRQTSTARERGYRKTPIPAGLRWEVWQRDDFTCRQCGSRADLAVDHIIPESKGGPLELENLQTLCRSCNSRKGAR